MTSERTTANEWRRRAVFSMVEMFRAIGRAAPEGVVAEQDGVTLVRAGTVLPFSNGALLLDAKVPVAEAIRRGAAFFDPYLPRWALIAAGADAEAATAATTAAGMEAKPEPLMLLTSLPAAAPALSGFEVRTVTTVAGFREYNDTMTAGFGDQWAEGEALTGDGLLTVPDLVHYTGYLDAEPVATAACCVAYGVGWIFNVSTVPAARRRGLGAAITLHAAVEAAAAGARAAALSASEMGEPVYRRIGFEPVDTVTTFLSPLRAPGGG
jgi:N-acetylglutamate synthase